MEIKKLKNNITLIADRVEYVRTASIGVWVRNGSIHENQKTSGLNHLIEHMIFKGTKKRNSIQIAREIDYLGGNVNAFSSREYSCYYARVISEHIPQALDLLGDIISNPIFDEKELENEKKVVIEEINMYDDSPDELVFEIFSQTYWGKDHPYGRPVLGTRKTVKSFKRKNIYTYHKQKYIAPNIVISITGKFPDLEILSQLIEESFSVPQTGEKNNLHIKEKSIKRVNTFLFKDTQQANVVIGTQGVSYPEERKRYIQSIFNIALGGGASSRLFQTLREKYGLVYTVYSFQTPYYSNGVFGIYFATSSDKTQQTFDLLGKELEKVRKEGLLEEEIKLAKNQLIFSLLMSLESTSNIMHRNGKRAIYECVKDQSIDDIITTIKTIQADEINSLLHTILKPQNFMVSIVGKKQKLDLSSLSKYPLKEIESWES